MADLPISHHFILQELSEGVFAAIHRQGGLAIGNAGIIDLGDRTLVFDTFLSPKATADLLNAAIELTGRPVSYVLNSHFHNDHVWGNQAVPLETDIITTKQTRERMAKRGTKEDEWYRQNAWQNLNEARLEYEQATDPFVKTLAKEIVIYNEAIVDTYLTLRYRLPTFAFDGVLDFYGSKRSAKFISCGAGHSLSDAFLHLPEDQILFLADLLFIDVHPYLGDGNPVKLCKILEEIKNMQLKNLVPGHGPVGELKDLDVILAYIREMEGLVKQALLNGIRLDQLLLSSIPPAYQNWSFPKFFYENLQFLYERKTAIDL